jgi:hypothetical protein
LEVIYKCKNKLLSVFKYGKEQPVMDEKENYYTKVEERLRDLVGQVDEMMWKTNDFARKARRRFRRSAENFRENQKAVTEKISGIRNAGGRSLKDLTEGLSRAMGELEKGFESAVQEFKRGETPVDVDESPEKKVEA